MSTHGRIKNPELRAVLRADALRAFAFRPLAPDGAWFKASTAPTAGANTTTTTTTWTKAYCPGWPVVPVFVVTEDTGDTFTAVSMVYLGTDQFGEMMTETVAATNSSGTWTGTATKAYQTLFSAALTITGTVQSADRFTIGFVQTYGLGRRIKTASDVIAKLIDGAADAGTLSLTHQTWTFATAPDAAIEAVLLVRPTHYYE